MDVRVGGSWDGILVIDSDGFCSGIHVRRRTEEFPLPFDGAQIEDVRRACLWNRMLAAIPFDVYVAALLVVFIASPALLFLAAALLPPLSAVAVVVSLLAIYVMYQGAGFPFVRPLAALLAVGWIIIGAVMFAAWASA